MFIYCCSWKTVHTSRHSNFIQLFSTILICRWETVTYVTVLSGGTVTMLLWGLWVWQKIQDRSTSHSSAWGRTRGTRIRWNFIWAAGEGKIDYEKWIEKFDIMFSPEKTLFMNTISYSQKPKQRIVDWHLGYRPSFYLQHVSLVDPILDVHQSPLLRTWYMFDSFNNWLVYTEVSIIITFFLFWEE